jgi:hypothetical protein
LGKYIILNELYFYDKEYLDETIDHEYGHYLQGMMFGWLYLIVIGIPSLMNNLIARVNKPFSNDYYNKYPEKWADKLGGVNRA